MRITLPEPDAFCSILTQITGTEPAFPITGITQDSRECIKGDLYIALKGEQVDGHEFIQKANQNGAVAALVEKDISVENNIDIFRVEDVLKTIGLVARDWRQQFNIPIVGITGSNGKTSTRDLLKHMFAETECVHGTSGNYNTSIGLPLTLLELSSEHSVSFLEMGANQSGDIAYLCSIAEPTHGIITNIAPAHLEGFGSVESVAKTKGELFDALSNGIAFVNLTNKYIQNLPTSGNTITFGLTPECDYPADIFHENDGSITLTIDTHEITTESHNLSFIKNVIAATSVSMELGMDWELLQERIKTYSAPKGRCEVKHINNITIIDDTYNANLVSTLAALDYLKAFSGNGRRALVFGDMFELGKGSQHHHQLVGNHCNEVDLDAVFTVGIETAETDKVLNGSLFHKHFDTKEDLVFSLKNWLQSGDKILVKGSRGMAMETIISDMETG